MKPKKMATVKAWAIVKGGRIQWWLPDAVSKSRQDVRVMGLRDAKQPYESVRVLISELPPKRRAGGK